MATSSFSSSSSLPSQADQQKLIQKLETFKIQGRDKRGRPILRIIGKYFPARFVGVETVKEYLEDEVFPMLGEGSFSIVYVNSGVNRNENFPGLSGLRTIYEAIPNKVRENLETLYFVHPGIQSRLFFATFGRILFPGGLYDKVKYVNRLEFLWDNVKRKEMEIPEFVYDQDEEMELRFRPTVDYGLESDLPRVYDAPTLDCTIPTYSMRCIS